MGFRSIFGAVIALAGVMSFALESSAADTDGARPRSRPLRYYNGGYFGRIGGHYYGTIPERVPFLNESIYNYPGHYNNQTFWERVMTQRNYPVQY